MFRGDANHQAFMRAEVDLTRAGGVLEDAAWLARQLQAVTAMRAAGMDPVPALEASLAREPARLERFQERVAACADGLARARQAIGLARGLVPDTAPPDPSGLEACGPPGPLPGRP